LLDSAWSAIMPRVPAAYELVLKPLAADTGLLPHQFPVHRAA
jgi:hypothetical protein